MFVDTILPRTWDGAHSAKYIGIVVDVKPEINMIINIEKGSTKLNVDFLAFIIFLFLLHIDLIAF
jgi:hypothetical protein